MTRSRQTNDEAQMPRRFRPTNQQGTTVIKISECHRRLIRTGLGACVTHLIRECAVAASVSVIGVWTRIVRHSGDLHAVPINVEIGRSRPLMRNLLCAALHFVAARSGRDSGCRCGRRSHSGCGSWRWAGVGVGVGSTLAFVRIFGSILLLLR